MSTVAALVLSDFVAEGALLMVDLRNVVVLSRRDRRDMMGWKEGNTVAGLSDAGGKDLILSDFDVGNGH